MIGPKNKIIIGIVTIIIAIHGQCIAQESTSVGQYTLKQIVELTKEKSISSLQASTIKENKYWQWRSFRSNYKPQLTLDALLPNFTKSNPAVTQPDGTIKFQSVSISNSAAQLSLYQPVRLTGGSLFVSTEALRFDNFVGDVTQYNANPILIGFNQPLFAFNNLKWDGRIEPFKYKESLKEYTQEMENIALEATNYFFDLLLAQINHEIASKNLANNDTIFQIAQVKYNQGRVSKNDLLQLKLNVVKSEKALLRASMDLETNSLRLISFMGIPNEESVVLSMPTDIPYFEVDAEQALSYAKMNRQESISFERQLIEAERDLNKAKTENGLSVNVFGSYGRTNTSNLLPELYKSTQEQQTLNIGLSIPVLDWGRAKSKIRIAEANKKLVEYNTEQQKVIFNQEVYTQVSQYSKLKKELKFSSEADKIANSRYEITKDRYFVGDIGITELNIALQEKDAAKQGYIFSLRDFWLAYYNLRRLTLYDFEKQEMIGRTELDEY